MLRVQSYNLMIFSRPSVIRIDPGPHEVARALARGFLRGWRDGSVRALSDTCMLWTSICKVDGSVSGSNACLKTRGVMWWHASWSTKEVVQVNTSMGTQFIYGPWPASFAHTRLITREARAYVSHPIKAIATPPTIALCDCVNHACWINAFACQ